MRGRKGMRVACVMGTADGGDEIGAIGIILDGVAVIEFFGNVCVPRAVEVRIYIIVIIIWIGMIRCVGRWRTMLIVVRMRIWSGCSIIIIIRIVMAD